MRRENLILNQIPESENENCKEKVLSVLDDVGIDTGEIMGWVKFPYSPILNYACEIINYACICFVYKDNRNSREDRIYTYLIILTYSPLWLL